MHLRIGSGPSMCQYKANIRRPLESLTHIFPCISLSSFLFFFFNNLCISLASPHSLNDLFVGGEGRRGKRGGATIRSMITIVFLVSWKCDPSFPTSIGILWLFFLITCSPGDARDLNLVCVHDFYSSEMYMQVFFTYKHLYFKILNISHQLAQRIRQTFIKSSDSFSEKKEASVLTLIIESRPVKAKKDAEKCVQILLQVHIITDN